MRSYCFLWMLVIAALISTQTYSKTNVLDNFFLIHYSGHSGGFQHIPLPHNADDYNTYAPPAIYNAAQNHSFTVTSLPGSPATTITLFFDDAVELVTFESDISVTVSQIRDNKYQVDINLPASKQGRTRAFSLTGAGTLDIEKNKVNGQPRQLKPLFNGSQYRGVKKTITTAEQWGHIVCYQGQLKSDLYREQEAWLQQPTPSTAVVMVVTKGDDPAPPAVNEGENTQSVSESGAGDQPPTSTQEANPASNNSDGDGDGDITLDEMVMLAFASMMMEEENTQSGSESGAGDQPPTSTQEANPASNDHSIPRLFRRLILRSFIQNLLRARRCPFCGDVHAVLILPSNTKGTTTTSQSCDSKDTKEDISRNKKEDPDDQSPAVN